MRKWLKKQSIAYWILSLALAVMFWLYVGLANDTETIKTIRVYPSFPGEDSLLQEKEIVVTGGTDVSLEITLRGRPSDLAQCTDTSVEVVARLNNITTAGTHYVYYNYILPEAVRSNVQVIRRSMDYFPITTDKIEGKPFDVQVYRGNIHVADEYMLEDTLPEPAQVRVRGPSEQLRRVAAVQVMPVREELNRTVEFPALVLLLDAEGNEIVSDDLSCDPKEVMVTLVISRVKEVRLNVELLEGGGAQAKHADVKIWPETVILTGDPAVLDALNVITLGRIDLAAVTDGYKESFPISIPNGVDSSVGLEASAEVTVSFNGLDTKRFDVDNITITGESPGHDVKLVTQRLPVTLRGPAADIDALSVFNIRVVADLTDMNLALGQQNVPVKVSIDGYPDVGVLDELKVAVDVAESASP